MKSEQEFLASMWSEIALIEYEARQNELARERSRKLLLRDILCGIAAAIFVGVAAIINRMGYEIFANIYLIGLALLAGGFAIDYYTFNPGGRLYENGNYH